MVTKTITIPDEIYEKIKDEGDLSEFVSKLIEKDLLFKERVERAKQAFGSCPDFGGMDGVSYVNKLRAEDDRRSFIWDVE
jgi:predicted CopG family antitoxin